MTFMEKPNKLCVAISGANGFVGKNLRKLLHKKGIDLVSITRRNFQNYKLETKIISPNLSKNISYLKTKQMSCIYSSNWNRKTEHYYRL